MPRTTVLDLQLKKAEGHKIAMVTAYDRTMARLVDLAGVDVVLVGDSLGMVVQGLEDTLPVTLDEMAYHARCVGRGLQRAHMCVDMPFMSYQVSVEQALTNAGRLVKEGGAQSVKLEGGERVAASIARIVESGIPVMGHVGLTPQSVHAMGGFRVQGKDAESARRVVADATAVAEAGAYALVLEGVPLDVAAEITASVDIPTIGIGAGPHCDGQVLVCTDLLGMDLSFQPKFVKRYAQLETTITDAFRAYVDEVRTGAFPTESQSFTRKGPRTIAKLYS
jgi:3-methyl-2-oxobutanoate hydroxymethyltransferase